MKWLIGILFALSLAMIWWGFRITDGPGSADERVGGSIPVLLGGVLLVFDAALTLTWLVVTR
ncbi:hypothetical protein A3862_27405 [Methylobacterium sp. XJLW]|jgi:hypothetical protein|uniref:hypothetical protein n=1 Tax=Methylobacterium sp. XJLW TaxID=739141 RepID=UPI000DAAE785|nr:hypothetical protein [Methylobacterium sp. XJLW]AWV18809.1 hypothetical protein A3862_27405 [Methylobacterium sp. XJLW]